MGIDPIVLGEPMGFWKHNMPEGMLLRSGVDWQLDPFEVHTFRAYLQERGLSERMRWTSGRPLSTSSTRAGTASRRG